MLRSSSRSLPTLFRRAQEHRVASLLPSIFHGPPPSFFPNPGVQAYRSIHHVPQVGASQGRVGAAAGEKEKEGEQPQLGMERGESERRRGEEQSQSQQRQRAVDSMHHAPLRDAADVLRAGGGKDHSSADEAKMLEALAVVESFAESEEGRRALLPFSGAIAAVVALAFGGQSGNNNSNITNNNSQAVTDAAVRALRSLTLKGDGVCDATISAVGAAAVPALLRAGGWRTDVGLAMAKMAATYLPHQRNAMLAAGVGPALIDIASEENAWVDDGARSIISSMENRQCRDTAPTPMQARAALPELMKYVRRPEVMKYVLEILCTLVSGRTPEHVQAALDAGVLNVCLNSLPRAEEYVRITACEVLSALSSGSAAQLKVMLEAGAIFRLCGPTNRILFPTFIKTAAALMKATGETDGKPDGAERAALLESHAMPQLLEAYESDDRYVAAAGVLFQCAMGSVGCSRAMLRLDFIEFLVNLAGTEHHVDAMREQAADTVLFLCRELPQSSESLARRVVPLLLPLLVCGMDKVGFSAFLSLRALREIVPETVDEGLRGR